MSLALAIFGTPDGFDFFTSDVGLTSGEVIAKFEALSFSNLSIPLGATAWGLFKRIDRDAIIIGVCKLMRAREYSSERAGGYVGAGFIFRNQIAPHLETMIAIDELMDAVVSSAFAGAPFKFVAARIADLPKTDIPESCKTLAGKLNDLRRPSAYENVSISSLYMRGSKTEIFKVLLQHQGKFSALNALIEGDQDLSQQAKAAGMNVASVADFEQWALAAERDIKKREWQANDLRQRQAEEAAERERAALWRMHGTVRPTDGIRRTTNGGAELSQASFGQSGNRPTQFATETDNNLVAWIAIPLSIVATALISILATYIVVRDPTLKVRYEEASVRLHELRAELEQLREVNLRLSGENSALREAQPIGKGGAPQEVQRSDRDRNASSDKSRR